MNEYIKISPGNPNRIFKNPHKVQEPLKNHEKNPQQL